MKFPLLLSAVTSALLFSSSFALPSPQTTSNLHVKREAPSRIPTQWKKISPASSDSPLTFQIHLNSKDEDGLDSRMMQIANQGDGKWLSTEELKNYVSATSKDQDAVISYLTQHGVSRDSISLNDLENTLTVKSMKVGDVSKLFNTDFSVYKLDGKNTKSIKAETYSIPHEIASHIADVNLNNFGAPKRTKPPTTSETSLSDATVKRLIQKSESSGGDASEYCDPKGVTPTCLRKLYGTYDYQPSSQDPPIGIMGYGDEFVSQADLTYFLQHLRPDAANYTIPIISVNGGTNNQSNPGGEAMLDVESVAGIAYPIKTSFYSYGNAPENEGGDEYTKTFQYFLDLKDSERPAVISISYGDEEEFYSKSQSQVMCSKVKQLASLGTTVVVASGDFGVDLNGDESCPPFRVDFVSACPYAVSVGATKFISANSTAEAATSRFFSSGGFSNHFPTPLYQSLAVAGYLAQIGNMDQGDYNRIGRAFPDLSAQGDDSVVRLGGKWYGIGGTSASCPEVAAIFGLINSARKRVGKGPVGWFNPTLYLAPFAFNDVTQGGAYGCDKDNKLGFPAKPFYDPVTGLGTPKFNALRAAFGA